MNVPFIPPVVKTIVVARAQEDAFRLYTQEFGKWWPHATHSLGGDKVAAVTMEGRKGGRIFERWADGTEQLWGTVVAWEPPRRVVHSWHVGGPPEPASEVEIRFEMVAPSRTRVVLEHRKWEKLGDKGREMREGYNNGWESVFIERFGNHAGIVRQ